MEAKLRRPTLKQSTFDWNSLDKYRELKNSQLDVNNIFKAYNTNQKEKISIIKNG